jgi:hypothetical protein
MTETQVVPKPKRILAEPPLGPYAPPVLTGNETVDGLILEHPGLRLAMMSYGLCTCCSGSLTLRQTAAARGIPLDVILADLERELAKGA